MKARVALRNHRKRSREPDFHFKIYLIHLANLHYETLKKKMFYKLQIKVSTRTEMLLATFKNNFKKKEKVQAVTVSQQLLYSFIRDGCLFQIKRVTTHSIQEARSCYLV